MNMTDKQNAYRAIKERFGLRAAQRDMLDATARYEEIMQHAHRDDWITVEQLLHVAGII